MPIGELLTCGVKLTLGEFCTLFDEISLFKIWVSDVGGEISFNGESVKCV